MHPQNLAIQKSGNKQHPVRLPGGGRKFSDSGHGGNFTLQFAPPASTSKTHIGWGGRGGAGSRRTPVGSYLALLREEDVHYIGGDKANDAQKRAREGCGPGEGKLQGNFSHNLLIHIKTAPVHLPCHPRKQEKKAKSCDVDMIKRQERAIILRIYPNFNSLVCRRIFCSSSLLVLGLLFIFLPLSGYSFFLWDHTCSSCQEMRLGLGYS